MRDISIWHRAEDIWQEAHKAAAEQRLAKLAERQIDRSPVRKVGPRRLPVSGFLRRLARGVAGFLTLVVAIGALAATRAEAATLLDIIRSLAENTLGTGTVKAVRIDREATVSLQWDSATYRPGNTAAVTRELLFAEAALATGNIIARLPDIRGIRFTITRGKQVLVTGEVWRVDSIRVDFAVALGGGTYIPDPKVKPVSPGGESGLQL